MPSALLAGLTGAFLVTGPASAAADTANVVVEVQAQRNILPAGGWSSIDVLIRNDGALPAAGVSVTLTLPAGLRVSGSESTSDWECDWGSPVMTCTHIGDFAPGESKRAIARTVGVEGISAGSTLVVGATATTTTPESSTSDNAATKAIRVVATGELRGAVFNDLNADGIRQAGEPAATDVGLSIRSQDDEDGYGFSNSCNGTYRYDVPTKRYQISSTLIRNNWRFTKPNVGSDATDSDLRMISETQYEQNGESPVFVVTAATPTVVDLGVVAAYRPTGIVPSSGVRGTTPTVKLTGDAFSTSLEVKLTRAGADPIAGTITTVAADRKTMDVTFPLATAATGAWTLTIDRLYGPHAEVANAFTITTPQLKATKKPVISGTVAVGSPLKTTPGTWTPAATSYRYQWLANGAAIKGATSASLTVPASAAGKRLTVQVTAVRAGYSNGVAVSPATAVTAKGKAAKATKKPAISGTAKVGQTLTASTGSWSPKPTSYWYEWRVNGKLVRSSSARTLKISSAWRNKTVTVTVVAKRTGYYDGRSTSAAVKITK
ncbi:hypothetical protein OWR29_26950 [Actinoplanes sp. Pm04-4]|uniref:SD-repeat containing protein B domain-containing protein n=1 Tax=Paractinoplanes pyxinae TaxID=2997416 RepID=A0ABT4B573_9ACTN|nr:SdrD B-like domain-containing protein [Actinoplanes pyxinae]MCY1141651.1 hypothetical protein [Actinoplanes pyxinae]